jgi:tetrahydromethanopterin S-methyltransferase subunit G
MMMVVPAMMMDNDNLVKAHQRLHEPYAGSGEKDCECD